MKPIIQTPRLLLRNWTDEDIEALIPFSADPVVMEHFPSTKTAEETRSFCHRMRDLYAQRGYCYFAVEEKVTEEMIGIIGLCYQDYEANFTPCVDIGWRLKSSVWGKGYATEGAKACLEFAKEKLQLRELVSVAVLQNKASIKVMQKIGMVYVETFEHPMLDQFEHLKECVLYRKVH